MDEPNPKAEPLGYQGGFDMVDVGSADKNYYIAFRPSGKAAGYSGGHNHAYEIISYLDGKG